MSVCGGIVTGQRSGRDFGPQMVLRERTDAKRVNRKSRELPQSMSVGSLCASAAKITDSVSRGRWEPPSNQWAGAAALLHVPSTLIITGISVKLGAKFSQSTPGNRAGVVVSGVEDASG